MRLAVAVILALVGIGSVVFHFMSPWWWTPIASNWGYIDVTIIITFWITGVVFIAVILFTAYCVLRFYYRPDRRAAYEPENKKLEWWLSIVTTLGVVGMLAPGLIVWQQYVTVPKNVSHVEVMGKQWSWGFRFPGKDGKFGKTNIRYVNADNPFGLDPKDPAGKDDVLIDGDDLHLPVNKPLKMSLRSLDVLHDFYVPQFRAKMDMVPGMVTYFWLTPTRAGTFDILCAELCGENHYAMRGKVIVETESAFKAWLAKQKTFAQTLDPTRNRAKRIQYGQK